MFSVILLLLNIIHFNGLFIIHFHTVDCLFSCFSHYFLIFYILLYDHFFLLNNNVFFVISNLIFWGVFMTSWFKCFKHGIVYFLSISEHLATIISPELNVLFLDMFFQPIFHYKCLITCHTHTGLFFFMGVLAAVISWTSSSSSMSHCAFKCYMSSCSISFFMINSSFSNNNVFFVLFYHIFWGSFMTGWFTFFIHVIVYLLSISEHLPQ